MKKLSLVIITSSCMNFSFAAPTRSDLEKKLDTLNIPSDKVSSLVSQEKLYSVNDRYSSLQKRFELTAFGANNFSSDDHIDSTLGGADLRFHYNAKWSAGLRYSEYNNKLSSAGEKLFKQDQVVPDTDYAIKSNEVFVNYNTIYGKLRLTADTVVYFDHYISIGYGNISLGNGETQLYTADSGFSFWFGKKFSSRIGMRNEFYLQQKINGEDSVSSLQGYASFGYLFGEGSRSL